MMFLASFFLYKKNNNILLTFKTESSKIDMLVNRRCTKMAKDTRCGLLIKQINNLLAKDADNSLRKKNLTFLQTHALFIIQKQPDGEMTLKELEKVLQVSQPDAAGIVVRLEKKGLIESFKDTEDKRVKRIKITELGLDCCKDAQGHIEQVEETLLLGMSEVEKVQFNHLLKIVLKNLSKEEEYYV